MIASVISRESAPLIDAQHAYMQGDKESARKQFHSLKGSLGNIGAMKVWDIVKDIEQAIIDDTPAPAVEALIEDALHTYAEMLSEAHTWLAHQNLELNTEIKNLDGSGFAKALAELIALLEENNMQAFDIYEDLRGNIFEHLSDAEQALLEEKIQGFEFNLALDTLKKLA